MNKKKILKSAPYVLLGICVGGAAIYGIYYLNKRNSKSSSLSGSGGKNKNKNMQRSNNRLRNNNEHDNNNRQRNDEQRNNEQRNDGQRNDENNNQDNANQREEEREPLPVIDMAVYDSFKNAFNSCLVEAENRPSTDQLNVLNASLETILPILDSVSLPQNADDEMKRIFKLLQRVKASRTDSDADTDVSLAEQVLFENYDLIIRESFLVGNKDYKLDSARDVFEKMLVCSGELAKKHYGEVNTLDETDDFALAKLLCNLRDNFWRRHSDFFGIPEDIKRFEELVTDGQFHVFNFTADMREMLLLISEGKDSRIAKHFFNYLDPDMKIFGDVEFFSNFIPFAGARKRYLLRKFRNQEEIEADYRELEALFENSANSSASVYLTTPLYGIRGLYKVPPKAVLGNPPVGCSMADETFNESLNRYLENPSDLRSIIAFDKDFYLASLQCSQYDDYNRKDADGSQVSYATFYGRDDSSKLLQAMLDFAAKKLQPLAVENRPESEYSCPLGSLMNFKERIDGQI